MAEQTAPIWRPTPQPACPCKFCTGETTIAPEPAPVIEAPEPRTCTEQDPCSFCGPVQRFWSLDPDPVPGGGDRLPYRTKGTS